VGRWLAALIVLTVSSPAWAEGEETKLELQVPTKVQASEGFVQPSAVPVVRPKRERLPGRSELLAIARDCRRRGPSRRYACCRLRALSGDDSTPIVLRPRVKGGLQRRHNPVLSKLPHPQGILPRPGLGRLS
jgi:hypothetical protein